MTEAELVALTAERLYIQLAGQAVTFGDNTAKMGVNPDSLARVSFELALAFHKAANSRKVVAAPTTANFDANMCDFDAWAAPATVVSK
jgi:hypothetical protein